MLIVHVCSLSMETFCVFATFHVFMSNSPCYWSWLVLALLHLKIMWPTSVKFHLSILLTLQCGIIIISAFIFACGRFHVHAQYEILKTVCFQNFSVIYILFVIKSVVWVSVLILWVVKPCGFVTSSDLEGGGSMYLSNTGICLQIHVGLQPKRPIPTCSLPWELPVSVVCISATLWNEFCLYQ